MRQNTQILKISATGSAIMAPAKIKRNESTDAAASQIVMSSRTKYGKKLYPSPPSTIKKISSVMANGSAVVRYLLLIMRCQHLSLDTTQTSTSPPTATTIGHSGPSLQFRHTPQSATATTTHHPTTPPAPPPPTRHPH